MWRYRNFFLDSAQLLETFYITFFQADKTFEECGAWCNKVENCKGFAVVDKKVRPGAKSCYLKDSLKYPGQPNKGVIIYYKLQEGL